MSIHEAHIPCFILTDITTLRGDRLGQEGLSRGQGILFRRRYPHGRLAACGGDRQGAQQARRHLVQSSSSIGASICAPAKSLRLSACDGPLEWCRFGLHGPSDDLNLALTSTLLTSVHLSFMR